MRSRRPMSPFIPGNGSILPRKELVIIEQDSPLLREHLTHPQQPRLRRQFGILCCHCHNQIIEHEKNKNPDSHAITTPQRRVTKIPRMVGYRAARRPASLWKTGDYFVRPLWIC